MNVPPLQSTPRRALIERTNSDELDKMCSSSFTRKTKPSASKLNMPHSPKARLSRPSAFKHGSKVGKKVAFADDAFNKQAGSRTGSPETVSTTSMSSFSSDESLVEPSQMAKPSSTRFTPVSQQRRMSLDYVPATSSIVKSPVVTKKKKVFSRRASTDSAPSSSAPKITTVTAVSSTPLSPTKTKYITTTTTVTTTRRVLSSRRASLDSSSLPPTSSSLFVPSSPTRKAGLFKKAVFYHCALQEIIALQSHVRGMIQRRAYQRMVADYRRQQQEQAQAKAVVPIQAAFRGYRLRRMAIRLWAVVRIQTMVRGSLCRAKLETVKMQRQAAMLEKRLAEITKEREQQLAHIAEIKRREKKRIYNLALKEQHEADSSLEHQLEQSVDNAAHIKELKASNKHLREENKTMKNACLIIAQKNQKMVGLAEQTAKNIRTLEEVIPILEADAKAGDEVIGQWQKQLDDYHGGLVKVKEHFIVEHTIGQKTKRTVKSLMKMIKADCHDDKLKASIIYDITAVLDCISKHKKGKAQSP